jgi:hypothetical protein
MVLMMVVFWVIFLGSFVLSCGQLYVVVFSRNNVECRSAGRSALRKYSRRQAREAAPRSQSASVSLPYSLPSI